MKKRRDYLSPKICEMLIMKKLSIGGQIGDTKQKTEAMIDQRSRKRLTIIVPVSVDLSMEENVKIFEIIDRGARKSSTILG